MGGIRVIQVFVVNDSFASRRCRRQMRIFPSECFFNHFIKYLEARFPIRIIAVCFRPPDTVDQKPRVNAVILEISQQ